MTRSSHSTRPTGRQEWDLVREAFERLCACRGVRACVEVPLLGRTVDVAFLRFSLLYTVEFKLHDWRRAITQARDHRLGTDYAYICMPPRTISEALTAALTEAGVGLFFPTDRGKWPFVAVVEAPRSSEAWGIARESVREYIMAKHGKQP